MQSWDLCVYIYICIHTQNFMNATSARVFLQSSFFPSPWFSLEFGDSGYQLGWLIEKPVPPKLKQKCGRRSPSFAFVASSEEKRTFSVCALSCLGDACKKYPKDFAPTNPNSISPSSWCLQKQGRRYSSSKVFSPEDLGPQQ